MRWTRVAVMVGAVIIYANRWCRRDVHAPACIYDRPELRGLLVLQTGNATGCLECQSDQVTSALVLFESS